MSRFAIALVDDKSDMILGYVSGYRRGGYYHPGSVVQCTYDVTDYTKQFDDQKRANRVASQYKEYSEAFMYDPSSTDYPMPSEKWRRKEVPTHLEVVEIIGDPEPLELSTKVKNSRNRSVKASKFYEGADTYVVKIWHEVDSPRGGLPSAAEEIFTTVAGSPSEAKEQVIRQWSGPIDRIEIVDINPEDDEYEEIPFN